MRRAVLDAILAARDAKTPVVLATHLGTGAQRVIPPLGDRPGDVPAACFEAAQGALRRNRSETWEPPERADAPAGLEGPWFLQVHAPPLRMIIVGAVHTAQPLARMADLAGYEVVVVDPREAFANEVRFPGIARSTDWPDDALTALRPDARTAVVTLTHDPKLDDPALVVALRSPAFYVGSLGSRRTHAGRLERLRADHGFGDAELARIHGPVGLAIGARSPGEVAVSILAEATAVLHGVTAPPLGKGAGGAAG